MWLWWAWAMANVGWWQSEFGGLMTTLGLATTSRPRPPLSCLWTPWPWPTRTVTTLVLVMASVGCGQPEPGHSQAGQKHLQGPPWSWPWPTWPWHMPRADPDRGAVLPFPLSPRSLGSSRSWAPPNLSHCRVMSQVWQLTWIHPQAPKFQQDHRATKRVEPAAATGSAGQLNLFFMS